MSALAEAAEHFERWREDPVRFVVECLHATPDDWQADILRAFPRHQRMALKGCKGPGKSTVEAWVAWNFLLTRPYPKVVATSITGANLKDGLWSEMAKWQKRSDILRSAFTWQAQRIVANDHPEQWWMSAREWSRTADPSQQADALAGVHADYVLYVLDEVGGIPEAVVATAEGALASGIETKLFVGGNPTNTDGPLHRICTKERDMWFVLAITGDPDDPKRAQRVSAQWAREQIRKYGKDNPWVRVNVYGEFPPKGSNILIGVDECEAAARRVIPEAEWTNEAKVLGVDVARFGDDQSVIAPRQGRVLFKLQEHRNLDTMELVGQVSLVSQRFKPVVIFVDTGGIGAGVHDRLAQLGNPVHAVDFGSRSHRHEPKLADHRTEIWWSMAEWIRTAAIPNDPELISQLTTPTYKFTPDNKIKLESKDELKKRGLPSPDKADAVATTFSMQVVAPLPIDVPGLEQAGRPLHDWDPFSERRA